MADEATRIKERVARARQVRLWWTKGDPRPEGVIGLALSGGGIRSATFSLGLIQALARSRRDALSKIDVLSTVSGGGYIGTFLRSLFLPGQARGIGVDLPYDPQIEGYRLPEDALVGQARFAARVLTSGPDQKNIERGRRNPIWWLREHSRYLAPNGPTDFGYAVAYLSRNWLAMLYVFVLAVGAIAGFVVVLESALPPALLRYAWWPISPPAPPHLPPECTRCALPSDARWIPLSPLIPLAVFPLVGSGVLSIAYWLTHFMSANEALVERQHRSLGRGIVTAMLGGVLIIGCWWLMSERLGLQPRLAPFPVMLASGLTVTAGAVFTLLGVAQVNWTEPLLTSELRRRLTKALAQSNALLLAILLLALLDSLGAGFATWLRQYGSLTKLPAVGLAPVAAFVLRKVAQFGEGKAQSGVSARLGRLKPVLALVAGLLLYGSVAVAVVAALHLCTWPNDAWVGPVRRSVIALVVGAIWILSVITGRSTGFINLSSLHLLYASRLTRAYLGASNMKRLEEAAKPGPGGEITDNDEADYIRPCLYGLTDLPAPIHIINTTINETIDPHSQLVARDRKGSLLSMEPGGIRAERADEESEYAEDAPSRDRTLRTTTLTPWTEIGKREVAEDISLGQWCAISGAAASSGMGRLTKLGYALAFTFANVRLGYWWWSPGVCKDYPPPSRFYAFVGRWIGTFMYLSNELTARYSRGYERKYLTDGGHFENSGVYTLLRRHMPLIVASDNGADPDYAFADLQSLIRTTRLDLGAEMRILGGQELATCLARFGCTNHGLFVDPVAVPGWPALFRDTASHACALILRVDYPAPMHSQPSHVIWIKPRLLSGLPQDVAGYAAEHSDFPQQTTANQFFDEAQWESYRKLGEVTMATLLRLCPALLA